MLETVVNTTPRENTPENTRENTPENTGVEAHARSSQSPTATMGPARARDAVLLLLIVRLRIASIQQLAAAVFPNVSAVVARRRLRALQHGGWLRTWDRPVARGGAPRYVYPTAKALKWAYGRLEELARGTAAETVVLRMIPASTKRLVQLEAGAEPQWFAHQDEINRLLLARAAVAGPTLVWASSWDCPLPDQLNGLKAPQPDYVLVTQGGDEGPLLIFGEHDRATEPTARWAEKLAAYVAARELSESHFGHAAFLLDITVSDPIRRAPLRRIRELANVVREAGCEHFVRLTLAGWLHALPNGRIWFAGGDRPSHDNLQPTSHPNLSSGPSGV
ncbi:MAG TPA: replication-relaxation family protein [Thermoanaerobaculia bacterium]|nr:replication-relaxation family protein [Thermoanaerobaculia bacterium]